jgi:hypothetical protein
MNENFGIFEQGWPGHDTVCGWGSTVEHTRNIRTLLPRLLSEYGIESVNDAGCGDLFWLKTIDLKNMVDYQGYDLYRRSTWDDLEKEGWKLGILDITTESMREADLAICRDVFIHLSNKLVMDALDRIKTKHKYLLATNFLSPGMEDHDYMFDNFSRISSTSMHHSKIDLRLPPFNLGSPLKIIPEDYPYKSTSLWNLSNA